MKVELRLPAEAPVEEPARPVVVDTNVALDLLIFSDPRTAPLRALLAQGRLAPDCGCGFQAAAAARLSSSTSAVATWASSVKRRLRMQITALSLLSKMARCAAARSMTFWSSASLHT